MKMSLTSSEILCVVEWNTRVSPPNITETNSCPMKISHSDSLAETNKFSVDENIFFDHQ
jgi:hypothetical protein